MLLESKILIQNELQKINDEIEGFLENQQAFEEKLEALKNYYLSDESVEKILQQIKKSRELEL
jgi:UDP-N-acetylglucosamine 2-epimerase